MKTGQPIREWQRPLDFLASAPLGWLIPHGHIKHFSCGIPVCTGEQSAEWAFLVLSGSCEQRRQLTGGEAEVLRTFMHGETFGGFLLRDTTVVAAEDCSVFSIRLRDLADITPKIKVNGHQHPGAPESFDTTRFTLTLSAPKGRIVTLAFFSDSLPETYLSETLARRLHAETGASVLLVQLITAAGADVDCGPEDGFALPKELPEIGAGLRRLRIRMPGERSVAGALSELFRILHYRFDYVLLSVPAERVPMEVLLDCIMPSHSVYFFLRRQAGDLYHLDLTMHELRPALKGCEAVELRPVLCLADREMVDGFDARIERIGVSPRINYIRGCPKSAGEGASAGSFLADIRRLARTIGNCLVGIALSSGAAKGYTHVGVLQVLEENGIEPDVVAGSSMGAYVGALWACGCNGAQLEKLARDMQSRRALWNLIDPVFPPRQGFLRGYSIKRRLQETIGEVQFCDLLRPFYVLATNLDRLERIVFSSGSVATAVHTSIAVPGIFVPVRIGEESFVDGGIVDPLPTDVLQEMGVKKIIAVNAIPSSDRIRACQQAQIEADRNTERRARKLAQKLVPLNQRVNFFARGNILEILMHSIHGTQIRMAQASGRRANVLLEPDICSDRWVDYRNPGQYIRAGREVALRQLHEIKALVQEKGGHNESEPAPQSMAASA